MSFLLLAFFFFKQKTAYEMRISDWSSDVCSSDLERVNERKVRLLRAASCSTLGPNRLHLRPPFLPPARHRVAHRAGVDIGTRNEGTGGGEVSIAGGIGGAGHCRATATA